MKSIHRLFFFFLFLMLSNSGYSTHIVGGDLTYKKLSGNTYQLKLILYFDCFYGNPQAILTDAKARISIFRKNNGSLYDSMEIGRTGPVNIHKVNYNCVLSNGNACVDAYTYITNINLPPIPGGYVVGFQRCCRNNSIVNIINPGDAGATYWTEIPTNIVNNSPEFKSLPPNFLCTNRHFTYDHSATDADGDVLRYELFQPFHGANPQDNRPWPSPPPYLTPVTWKNPYNTGNMMGGNPILTIDSITGRLDVTPTVIGQFVVGILVKEYRAGVLIGVTRRDYQFNVVSCVFEVVSNFFTPTFQCQNKVSFSNYSTGTKPLSYHWDFGVPSMTSDTSVEVAPVFTYPATGTYNVTLIARTSTCADTFTRTIHIYPPINPALGRDTFICNEFKLTLNPNVFGATYKWSTGETTPNISVNKGGVFWVDVTKNGCVERDSINIINSVVNLNLGVDTHYCTSFKRLLDPGPGFAKYLWHNSSGSQTYLADTQGVYWVEVTKSDGCSRRDTITFSRGDYPIVDIGKDTQVCLSGSVVVRDALNPGASFKWSTSPADTFSKVTIINKTGMFWVDVTRQGCTTRDTINILPIIINMNLGRDTSYCGSMLHTLNAGPGFVRYLWNDNSSGQTLSTTKPGQFWAEVENNDGCIKRDTVNLVLNPLPDVNLGSDTAICIRSGFILDAGPNMAQYHWHDGFRKQIYPVMQMGKHWVRVVDNFGCENSDTVTLSMNEDISRYTLYVPNSFTPNGDGLNDLFPTPGDVVLDGFEMKIFNRWGEKVFDTSSNSGNRWDGDFMGRPAVESVYVYLITWITCDGNRAERTGALTLLRP